MAKRYTQEIHQAALKRYFIGKQTAAQIGREMGIPHQTIGAWITSAKFGQKGSEWTPRRIRGLCGKVKRLENIITVLKSVDCTVQRQLQIAVDAPDAHVAWREAIVLEIPCPVRQFSRGSVLQIPENGGTLPEHLPFRSGAEGVRHEIHRLLQQRTPAQISELPHAHKEGRAVLRPNSSRIRGFGFVHFNWSSTLH